MDKLINMYYRNKGKPMTRLTVMYISCKQKSMPFQAPAI